MALSQDDLSQVSRYVQNTVQRLPARDVKAQTIGTVTTDQINLTNGNTVLDGNLQGIQKNQAVVWDGFKFVPMRASSIPVSTYSAFASGPPASPQDGDLWYADGTGDQTIWSFRYNAGSSSPYKWEFIGGSDRVITITSYTGWNINSWTAMNGVAWGTSRSGDYMLNGQWSMDSGGADSYGAAMGLYQGSGYVLATGQSWHTTFGADYMTIHAPESLVTNTVGSTGAVALMYYAATSAPSAFFHGQISIRPVRVI